MASLSDISIKRPVLATVFSIIIVLFGIIGFSFLGVREFPSVDPPVITVSTNYTGANADVIESQITEPLEESINGISGIRNLTSISSDGRSSITVEFDIEVDLEAAANDVRDRVSRAQRNLPRDCDPPIVVKSDADAETILSLTVQSNKRNLLELTEIGNNLFKERLQTIPGVSEIRIWGEKKYAIRLLMDPAKLAAYGITPLDVSNALNQENVELPSGRIEGNNTELSIRTFGRLSTPEQFNDLIIKEESGSIIRFRDIGEAILSPENERSILRGNNFTAMIGIAVTPQPGSNYVAIADEFYKRVAQMEKDLPEDLTLGYALDTTQNIRKAITEVEETIFIAFGLVVLVIFAFLRDWRTTLIPVVAIPISLVGAFFIMYLFGFSINILTLLGIVLATGLVVDDAIVVLENIYQKIENGMQPREAGFEGAKEIYFAIISTTITLAAVFLPIIFLQGITGRLFREFGIVVAGSVIISAFVSLTLTPMMSTRLLKQRTSHGKFYEVTERFFTNLTNAYHNSLKRFIEMRWIALVIMAVSIGMIFIIGKNVPSELAPLEDKSRVRIISTAPEGTSYEAMDEYILKILAVVDTLPETESVLSVTAPGFGATASVNSGFVRLTLVEPDKRDRSQQEIADQLSAIVKEMPFARTFVTQEETIGGGRNSGLPVQFVIQAPNFEKLKEVIPTFMEKAQADPAFQVVDLNLKFNKPEITVEIDRDKARSLGVSVRDVAETLQLYFSGQRFGYFIMDGKQYQVIGQANRANRNDPLDLSTATVRSRTGELIQLANLVKMSEQSSPPQLYRFNRYVSATISAAPAKRITLGQGIDAMDKIAKEVLDDDFSTSLTGTSKEFAESSNSLLFAFLFALVLIYLILSAQFESFVDPLIIMFTVPLAISGAVLSLWLFGNTLNIFSQIGIIVLIGIVTKNGILIVEFANQKKEEGLQKFEAVLEASTLRLRPILMTSLATILGALPIALALGAASKSRVPMGIAIIGGLLFSLILTLYVIPALYTYMSRHKVLPAGQENAQEKPVEQFA
ncbi:efflux RND transporter permease subunit [Cytophagales bacterium LB-30]|uniref:Efflux RND transporter permease subunit n=1 Tax=Shiella aurantiaca TaxID=3058365 RepID=A0ABT8F5P1_9BACT|nr:efflux RND transporter permease subunit [Shiella aurantiaca]MDN4165618.1 efflux RND transporter permease subunit [Shiella aurantiaca]